MTAVDALDLEVQEGTITAFLGPNGAGKTTTISLLLGLIKAQAGSCEVLGYPPGHPKALAQLGAMVESPSLYDHLTGTENIEITRLMRNLPPSESDRVLTLVGLKQDAKRPVRNYSLGMRQRLGMALALIGSPRLLILDEPTNGLDPEGIREIRDLIRKVPLEIGATVFLSSHILAEVEQVASQVAVIHRGRLRYQGAIEGLGTPSQSQLQIRVDNPAKAVQQLGDLGFPAKEEGGLLLVQAPETSAPEIASSLIQAGLSLYELAPQKLNLEARFLSFLEEK
ncbi:MAG TPA: ABC transporter ATP-binding protein [Geothrix sp.]|nr:ABC transporter ATP-binding protein [Geothrix sp.]